MSSLVILMDYDLHDWPTAAFELSVISLLALFMVSMMLGHCSLGSTEDTNNNNTIQSTNHPLLYSCIMLAREASQADKQTSRKQRSREAEKLSGLLPVPPTRFFFHLFIKISLKPIDEITALPDNSVSAKTGTYQN